MKRLGKHLAALAILSLLWASTGHASLVDLAVADVVAQVSQETYQHYLDDTLYTHTGDNRGVNGPEHDLARDNIYAALDSFGLETLIDPLTTGPFRVMPPGGNVVATHYGTVRPDEIFVLGAHYDSVNNPGADDNASGTAAVMEAARVLSQYEFEATILFIAFDEEEVGLVGSSAWVDEYTTDDIQAMISLDMIAYNGSNSNRASIYGREESSPLKDALALAAELYGGLTAVDFGRLDASDHAPFEDAGFQACLLIEYDVWTNPHYHRPTDTVDTPGYIDYAYATDMVRSAVGYLATAAVLIPEPATLVLLGIGVLLAARTSRPRRA